MSAGAALRLSESAARIRASTLARWGDTGFVEMVGHSPALLAAQAKLEKAARYQEPVLITGESGVGKELFAKAIHSLGSPAGRPFVTVNCPQFQEGNLTVSELFGHVKGSFTGAIADHRGAFEEADGGVIFLDEIGDMHPNAQAMLLRSLSTGEFRPLGASRSRSADVRVVSATNRSLNQLVMSNQFRYDLFFRLRHFHLAIPPLRDRGDDWRLILDHALDRLRHRYGIDKRFSAASLDLLSRYGWPGNIRQAVSLASAGYAMADRETIEPDDFESFLDTTGTTVESDNLYERVTQGGEDCWAVVFDAFMNRDLNRSQVRTVVKKGLAAAGGNYRRLLEVLRLPDGDYQKVMDFLRHHDLKP